MGQVCTKHHEFYEKKCRWCEPTQVEYRIDTTQRYAAPKSVVMGQITHPEMISRGIHNGVMMDANAMGLCGNSTAWATQTGWPATGWPSLLPVPQE